MTQLEKNSIRTSQTKQHFAAGKEQRQQGKLTEVVTCFQAALRCQKDYLLAYNNLANLYQLQGKLDDEGNDLCPQYTPPSIDSGKI